jgi:DNA-directed RNA polymerase specialized sigma24 family protein
VVAIGGERLEAGGGRVRGESALLDSADPDQGVIEQVIGSAPTPDDEAAVSEECRRLLRLLPDDECRAIAVWKMEGHTNEQVAERVGCAVATVERRLRVIRKRWQDEDTGRGEWPA